MNSIGSIKEIKVGLNFGNNDLSVGRLALHGHSIYFEYDRAFIEKGLEISPLRMPLKPGVMSFDYNLFEGLPGVFNDSLPDGWGRLLLDRWVRTQGLLPSDIGPLDRLACVGAHGMGALVYEPDYSIDEVKTTVRLDDLSMKTKNILNGVSEEILEELLSLNGSSAGARPKALVGVDSSRKNIVHGVHNLPLGYTPWVVKFVNSQEDLDAGAMEYVYALMAKEAGVVMPDVHLFPARKGQGYFATQRFDRNGPKRLHVHTACGLLHSDFRMPSLDYEDLIALTSILTRDMREVEKMYRLAVFNVLAHNRDDHAKNFSFLMDEKGEWKLSPAYDLTFSSGPRGEQSTMVLGEGSHPSFAHLIQLGEEAKIPKNHVQEIIEQTGSALAQWPRLAKQHGVSSANIVLVEKRLKNL